MALTLLECEVVSVPLNILIPLAGTPVEHNPPLAIAEILRTIALYRLIFKDVPIRLAAGRGETGVRDFLGAAFMAGADGLMIGGYLTQGCRPPEEDLRFVAEMQALWNASMPLSVHGQPQSTEDEEIFQQG
jgi:biotin synthase